jgi:hypothetical protein
MDVPQYTSSMLELFFFNKIYYLSKKSTTLSLRFLFDNDNLMIKENG